MKKVFLLFVMIISQFPCFSQITHERNGFRAGDILVRHQLNGLPSETIGLPTIWDLRGLDIVTNSYLKYIGTSGDSLSSVIAIGNRKRQSFLQSESELLLEGYENYTTRMNYNLKEKRLAFPIFYGDSISGLFSGYGNYCDKIFIREFGRYKTKVDSYGTLILLNGDTLNHVLRITSEHLFSTKTCSLDSIREIYEDSIPVYTSDSISFYMSDENRLFRSETQYWYALGYRYPILETFSLSEGENAPSSIVTWYISPDTQQELENDEENLLVRNNGTGTKWKGLGDTGNTNGNSRQGTLPFSYMLQNNENSQTILLSFTLSRPVEIKVSLADIMGVVYKNYTHNYDSAGDYEIPLDYRGLRRGEYIIYINANGSYAVEKFSKK